MHSNIINFLRAHKSERVEDILEKVIDLASSNSNGLGKAYIKDSDGPIAVKCGYFKRWMPLVGTRAVEFGIKKSSLSGLNSICKEGSSHWTKQNSTAKNSMNDLLSNVENGSLAAENISAEREKIETARLKIEPTESGFETKEEVIEYLKMEGFEVLEQG